MMQSSKLLGVSLANESKKNILKYVVRGLTSERHKFFIVTPNPEIVVYAHHHSEYMDVLNKAEIALPDGVGLVWASKLLGIPLNERFSGVDFIEEFCLESKEKHVSMGFVGGRNNVAMKAADCLKKKYPWIEIVFVGEEWSEENQSLLNKRKGVSKHIDILFVAFGFPKQEQWIFENLEKIPVTAAMGVGGSFDFISGEVRRAPSIIRRFGFEWLFRLIVQPWRIKRQLSLLEFCYLVFKEYRKKM